MRDLVFIPGAGGAVDDLEFRSKDLIGFLTSELAQDYRMRAPLMPSPEDPDAMAWLDALEAELVDFPDDSVLIGHSMGGAMILLREPAVCLPPLLLPEFCYRKLLRLVTKRG